MRKLILPLVFLAPSLAMAQQVVAGGGGHHANSNTAITYTIGEPVIATVSAAGNTLTQGFNQPWADITTVMEEATSAPADINVYPNPVRHTLHIATDVDTRADHFILHDAAGRIIANGRITGTITELDMEQHASGSYFLRVFGPDDKPQRSFQISVTH